MRHLCCWLALVVGFGLTACSVPSRAADKADPDTIDKWIGKLSSSRFVQREKAQKALEAIGLPALEALRKAAAESKDMETRRRAVDLVTRMEKEAQAARVLAPRRLRLTYKDTPLKDALADFSQKSGYPLTLIDPQNKLKDRKVTLDTGDTTFWQAFDQFCAKAGLTEASQQALNQGVPFPQPAPVVFPMGRLPGGILPVVPPKIGKPLPPLNAQPAAPIEKQPAEKIPPQKKQVQARQQALRLAFAQQAAAPIQIQVAPALQPALRFRRPFVPQPAPGQPGPIYLKDGKDKAAPTDYAGAVRIRAVANAAQVLGAPAPGESLVGLQVSLEPKIRWQNLVAVRVDKAMDDQGQALMPAMGDAPAQAQFGNLGGQFGIAGGFGGIQPGWVRGGGFQGFAGGFGGLPQYVPVRLKKGEKASRSLKELTGNLTVQVLAEPEVAISADNILKAAGKTFKGKDGGTIAVKSVEEKDGRVTVRVELVQPANVVPAQGGIFGPLNGPFNGPMILPLAPPQRARPALPGGAFQIQVGPGQVWQVQQIQIIGGGGAIQLGGGGPGVFNNASGLELLDDKGKPCPTLGTQMIGRGMPGGGFTMEHQLTFQLAKDQKAARLVFKGSKRVNVEIPFRFKNVPLS